PATPAIVRRALPDALRTSHRQRRQGRAAPQVRRAHRAARTGHAMTRLLLAAAAVALLAGGSAAAQTPPAAPEPHAGHDMSAMPEIGRAHVSTPVTVRSRMP